MCLYDLSVDVCSLKSARVKKNKNKHAALLCLIWWKKILFTVKWTRKHLSACVHTDAQYMHVQIFTPDGLIFYDNKLQCNKPV